MTRELIEQTEWDAIPDEFNEWWNRPIDSSKNPYRKDSPAYWAWEGWKAAMRHIGGDCA